MYDEGLGVARNDNEAVKWYRRAADQGFADAQYNLALMYETGEGVAVNQVYAYMWFDIAAKTYPVGADRDDAIEGRNDIAGKMTPKQIAKAKQMAARWKPRSSK
jgi:TPR repeat protein